MLSQTIIKKLLEWQPEAVDLRQADICPNCGSTDFVSYRIERLHTPGQPSVREGYENCGYWCASCDFGNAGARIKMRTQ